MTNVEVIAVVAFIPAVLLAAWLIVVADDVVDRWQARRRAQAIDRMREEYRITRAEYEQMTGQPLDDHEWDRLCVEHPDLVGEDT